MVIGRRASIVMKLGLRNIPRRPVRAGLIVFGLMLATTVIGSAFATGDIMTYTMRSLVTDNLGSVDEVVLINPPEAERGEQLRALSSGSFGGLPSENLYFFFERNLEDVQSVASDSETIAATLPAILDRVTLVHTEQQQLQGSVMLMAIPLEYPDEFGRLESVAGSEDLSQLEPDEVFINAAAADDFDIQPGDVLQIGTWENRFALGGPWYARVKAVVNSAGLTGSQPALIADINRFQDIISREGLVNVVLVANEGGIDSVENSEAAASELRVALADHEAARGLYEIMQKPVAQQAMTDIERALDGAAREEYTQLRLEASKDEMTGRFISLISEPRMRHGLFLLSRRIPGREDRVATLGYLRDLAALWVLEVKRDGMQEAEQYGNVVTTVFLVLGIFSIGASVLLIALIFNLLATDRSGELATMRAMGMRRIQIMGVFLFEGLAYNLAGAVLGALAGLASAYLTMVSLAGTLDDFGINLEPRIEPGSMLLAFSL
ncbi:MAG TPA: FtsX-like permease family protein, partial [Thermomicrobiales bacterium]|nr:FtsX-like permease family protein [Thermomicrobiales bacterium]